jgi:hypothetical protein
MDYKTPNTNTHLPTCALGIRQPAIAPRHPTGPKSPTGQKGQTGPTPPTTTTRIPQNKPNVKIGNLIQAHPPSNILSEAKSRFIGRASSIQQQIPQNKPNFQTPQTTTSPLHAKTYANINLRPTRKNKPNIKIGKIAKTLNFSVSPVLSVAKKTQNKPNSKKHKSP